MSYWKPSKATRQEYGEKMREIDEFCRAHDIHKSLNSDSYYFRLNGQDYRVSNHSVEVSNRGAYDEFGNQMRELYHPDGRDENVIYILASKTRLIEIYKALEQGQELDARGRPRNIKK